MSAPDEWFLKSVTRVPAGGWYYRCPSTGWVLPNRTSGMLEQKAAAVLSHNQANPGKDLPTDIVVVTKQVHDQTVQHILETGMATSDIHQFPKAQAPVHRLFTKVLPGPRSIIARVADVVANDVIGVRVLTDWFGKGLTPVPSPVAEKRAKACDVCPANTRKERPIEGAIAEAVRWAAAFKSNAELRVSNEENLGTCDVCGCPLKTKIWVPLKTINEDTSHVFPDECWITEERNLRNPQFHSLYDFAHSKNLPNPPPVTEQTSWPCGLISIPARAGELWFNGSIVRINGQLWIASRLMRYPNYLATIVFVRLNDAMEPQERVPIKYTPTFPGEHFEDGRCIPIPSKPGHFYLAASNFTLSSIQHQGLFEVDSTFRVTKAIRIEWGGNAKSIDRQRSTEKNWQFFIHEGRIHFVHWISPKHIVCEVEGEDVVTTHTTDTVHAWPFGTPHGGTPPIRIGDLYWSFFHSHQLFTPSHRRYFIGAYAFEAKPPFAVKYMSRCPFLGGTNAHPIAGDLWKHLVVFPAGSIYDQVKREWLLTFGVNDCDNAWIRIPHSELLQTVV